MDPTTGRFTQEDTYQGNLYDPATLHKLFVIAQSKYATIKQTCYISTDDLKNNSDFIKIYIQNNVQTYVEFGKIEGNYSPAFSMKLYPCDDYGHLVIEVDMEIADNKTRAHRCKFFINTELGMMERFGNNLKSIIEMEIDKCIFLHDQ